MTIKEIDEYKMKRLMILMSLLLVFASCGKETAETWRMTELSFVSATDYSQTRADEVMMDVTFTHKRSGKTITRPAFWDGGNIFLVRFAPTAAGIWEWSTACPQDESLASLEGSLRCKEYDGDLEIYRRGFVTVVPGNKHFTYADGTPFFYLGDTHWGMLTEEYDSPGHHAGNTGAESHFKYIVDRRVDQGFTVYQSEPIGSRFKLGDGTVDQEDIEGFRHADGYFEYIADAGLVHANSQFFFPSEMTRTLSAQKDKLEQMSRYWVARFGAWPVMWTLGQEIDNDSYNEQGFNNNYSYQDNPWVEVAEYIHKYDSYSHPLSGHQEHNVHTTVTGVGWKEEISKGRSASIFVSDEVAARTGHNWWAAQWGPQFIEPAEPELIRDYYNSTRPAVNYEGKYCGLWTQDFGSRVQGWSAFLCGFCGYGYGAIDIWLYNSAFDIGAPSFDGVDSISIADKKKPWSESIEYPSARQMGYLRSYMESFDWWNLVPVLCDQPEFEALSSAYAYARTDKRHVLYFFARNELSTGTIKAMEPGAEVRLEWFNPRTGETMPSVEATVGIDGALVLPQKPDVEDWTLTILSE
jgi:hypothetical protein